MLTNKNKEFLKKLSIIFLIIFFLRIFLIQLLDITNVSNSHYIEEIDDKIIIEEKLGNDFYTIMDTQRKNTNSKTLYIKDNAKQNFTLLLNKLTFIHKIFINDELVSQNIDQNQKYYNSDFAYKYFDIDSSDYLNKEVKIKIEGDKANEVDVFLAKNKIIKDKTEFRTILNVILLMLLSISTLISLIIYCHNKSANYFIVFFIMGIVSIIKSISLGELFIICKFIGITAYNYNFLDISTTVTNIILLIIMIFILYNIKIRKKWFNIGLVIFCVIGAIVIIIENVKLYYLMFIIIFIISNIIVIIGFIKDKPYSKAILINGVFYSSFVSYHILVLKYIFNTGIISFLINPSYLGAVIYMNGFLFVCLLKWLDEISVLEDKRKEYERVSLLRGISHDLKLPLSVIKLNNQMIEKYNLSNEEIKQYAKTSLKATQELEDMTDNINSYLSLKQFYNKEQTTSIKECFEKLNSYYCLNNKYNNKKIIVECNDKDIKLEIDSLQFSRMLYNLIDNALKYSNDSVCVKASYKIDEKVSIIVEDNGIGMDQEETNKILDPFYQIDHSRSKGGLGLGLSVVKETVSSLGGVIDIKTKKGKGTIIIITFPKK